MSTDTSPSISAVMPLTVLGRGARRSPSPGRAGVPGPLLRLPVRRLRRRPTRRVARPARLARTGFLTPGALKISLLAGSALGSPAASRRDGLTIRARDQIAGWLLDRARRSTGVRDEAYAPSRSSRPVPFVARHELG